MNLAEARKHRAALGRKGENAACSFLKNEGMTILARNWRCKAGELDIVALDGDELVFAEVKTSRFGSGFNPAHNLSPIQRKRNYHAAGVYMRVLDINGYPGRFDLIEVIWKNRFSYSIHHHRDYLPHLPPRKEFG